MPWLWSSSFAGALWHKFGRTVTVYGAQSGRVMLDQLDDPNDMEDAALFPPRAHSAYVQTLNNQQGRLQYLRDTVWLFFFFEKLYVS